MWRTFGILLASVFISSSLLGQADYKRYYDEDNLPGTRQMFQQGRYEIVIQICDYSLRRGQPSWEWRTLRFQSLAKIGKYEEAVEEARETTNRFPEELGALLAAYEFFEKTGHEEDAARMLDGINKAALAVPKQDRTALDLVHLGRAAVILGADPALVLEQYFGPAKATKIVGEKVPPGVFEAHLHAGLLALDKEDYKRAAEEFRAGLKLVPGDVELLFGLARAVFPSSRKEGQKLLEKIVEESPRHDGALLLETEYAINFENYDEAKALLEIVEATNPRHPLAHAYRAILAELMVPGSGAFEEARNAALSVWKKNPEIDHIIGRVLSKKYRYAEGAESQRRALAFDDEFLPAKLQLAHDLLRLGKVDEAWPLVAEVAEADEYNVQAYNLEILKQEIESFTSVETDDFIIRLPQREADVYGERVVEILTEAKEILGKKYGLVIEEPTLIEFYPDQQDFAIRSFGSLGGQGLLGVCFGSVVTMNSPGSTTAGKNNWEATLWHEYCHVVTLTATNNKMPRWLSEGISVYEEMQRQSNWGQRMTPRYREIILEEEALTPISEMSQAFFNPKSGEYVMFAYYQSMLVVKFIVENYGEEALRNILKDLGKGVLINDAIAKHTEAIELLELDFEAATIKLAESYGNDVDWRKPEKDEVNPLSSLAVAAFLKKNPRNLWALQSHANFLIQSEKWDETISVADRIIELVPEFTQSGNGYALKAKALREKGDLEGEITVLETLASLSAEALSAYTRLLEADFEARDWGGVLTNSDRTLAINPFLERTHYCRGCAFEGQEKTDAAVDAFETVLALDPANPSEVRFRLARLLAKGDRERARRYLLDSLADSPRYREAFSLLLEIVEEKPSSEG